jgi:hypothetical protein
MELDKWAVLVRDKLKQQPVDLYSGTEAVPFEALNRVYLSLLEIWPINGEHPLIEVDPHAE